MSSRTMIILGAFGAFILAGAAYLIFFSNSASGPAITDSQSTSAAEALFLNLSDQLDSISFDTSVLSDPRFTSLVDIHTPILPETSGRSDPFGPLSGVSTSGT